MRLVLIMLFFLLAAGAPAQDLIGPPAPLDAPARPTADLASLAPDAGSLNPLEVLDAAGRALPGRRDADAGGLSPAITVLVLLTVVTLAPAIMLMTTCFIRIIVVMGLLKQAMGLQTIPPPQVTLALSLFMTAMVMSPTLDRIYAEAVVPYRQGSVADYEELWDLAKQPMRDFMFDQIDATNNWSSLYMLLEYRGVDVSNPEKLSRADVDMVTLIPAYMLSELKTAFLMGFRVYLPFLIIDIVISSMLISMSMMMVPPVLISLPFKLLLFVLVDGWTLVVGSLLRSFATGGGQAAQLAAGIQGLGFA